MLVALYPRVSGLEQAQEGYSIGEQIERMKKYCEAKGWTVYKIYTDAGFTGANMERPGLQEMIKDSEAGKFDMVLVYKLDRLSRSQKDVLYLVEDVFDEHGVFFSSMTENFDTSTPFGKAILGILAVFAQLEREQIRERTMMGKKARAEQGKWHGGSTQPIGYDYSIEDDMLYINEYEAMQVRDIVDLFLKRTPVNKIETICEEKGYKHKHGVWSAKGIKRVLASPLYVGMIKDGDDLFKGIHEPLFDQATFDEIQAVLNERKEKYGTAQKHFLSLLGGMIYCKHCGAKYCRKSSGENRVYYSCYSRNKTMKAMIKDPNCKNKNYRAAVLEELIIGEISKLAINPDYIDQVKETKPLNDNVEKSKTIQKEIEGISSQISKLMDLYSLGAIPLEIINQKVTSLNDTKIALEKEFESLAAPDTDDEGMTNQEIQTLAGMMNDENITLEDKRRIIQSLIYYIEIDNENIAIHWKF